MQWVLYYSQNTIPIAKLRMKSETYPSLNDFLIFSRELKVSNKYIGIGWIIFKYAAARPANLEEVGEHRNYIMGGGATGKALDHMSSISECAFIAFTTIK